MTALEQDIADPKPAAPAAAAPARRGPGRVNRWLVIALVVAIALVAALGAAAWRQKQELDNLSRESARRFGQLSAELREVQTRSRQSLSMSQDSAEKLASVDARLTESQSQQAALEQLYQELSRGEDEWVLIEVEQALAVAAQQLQLAGNVRNAIAALEVADARLARADRPQFAPVRAAIARDKQRLAATPGIDVAGTAGRLDQLIVAVDSLPLLSSVEPRRASAGSEPPPAPSSSLPVSDAPAAAPADADVVDEPWWRRALGWLTPVRDALLRDTHQLVRIQRIDQPGALLVSPEQAAMLRENLKLRLLGARIALLGRQEGPWRSDLAFVAEGLNRYFDPEARPTVRAQSLLKQIQTIDLNVQAPDINESLNAARAVLPRNAPAEGAR